MLRRLLGTILIILGLAAAGLGVASATVWREPDSVVSTATPQGDGTLVVTDPGVLELVGTDVTVVATVPGDGKVTVAIGRDVDVEGWVGIDHSTRVHGLADWDRLTTSAVEPELPEAPEGEEPPTPGVGADPAGNDMWVAEATGEGSVSLRWTDRPGRWSLIAAGVGEDAQAPTVELTWPRPATTPWLWPGVGVGAALAVAGLLVLFVRRTPRAAALGGAAPADPTQDSARTEGTTTPDDAEKNGAESDSGLSDAAASGAGPSLAGRWPAPPTTRDPGPSDAATPDAADQPDGADATGAEGGEAEQRPARPALISRRARRRAAQEPQDDAAAANGEPTGPGAAQAPHDPEPSGLPATAQAATPEQKPAGRGWAFSPVFGGSSTPAPEPPQAPEQPQAPVQPLTPPPAPTRRQALSRRQVLRSQPAPSPQPAPAPAPEPATPATPATPTTPAAPDAATTTGSMPRLTRRELRAQEEARRAAEQTGITGRLRALTGSVPVVRPTPPVTPGQDPAEPPTRASRSQAWRQAWGFDPDGSQGTTDDTEGGAR